MIVVRWRGCRLPSLLATSISAVSPVAVVAVAMPMITVVSVITFAVSVVALAAFITFVTLITLAVRAARPRVGARVRRGDSRYGGDLRHVDRPDDRLVRDLYRYVLAKRPLHVAAGLVRHRVRQRQAMRQKMSGDLATQEAGDAARDHHRREHGSHRVAQQHQT